MYATTCTLNTVLVAFNVILIKRFFCFYVLESLLSFLMTNANTHISTCVLISSLSKYITSKSKKRGKDYDEARHYGKLL